MTRTNPRLALLLTIVLAVSGAALFVAGSAGGQSETDAVPVDFQSSGLDKTSLHFAREGSGSECTATMNATAARGQEANVNPLCQMLVEPPKQTASADPDSERRVVQSSAKQELDDQDDVVRFTLDARPDDPPTGEMPDKKPNGAEYPFSVRSSASSLTTVFHYSTDAVCDEDVPEDLGKQQPLKFHVNYYKVSASELQDNSAQFDDPIASSTKTHCGNAAGDIDSQNADKVSVTTSLDEPVSFDRGDAIVTEIYAVNAEGDDNSFRWEIYFGDDSFDSRTEVKSPEAVQHAMWTTDRTGTVKDNFDPDAAEGDRFLVPHLALRSPFGGDAIIGNGDAYDLQIRDPSGRAVDLLTDDDGTTGTLALEEQKDLSERSGAKRVFEIENPSDNAQPWNYPADLEPGAYEVQIEGNVIRDTSRTFTKSVAMGAFDFDLEPVEGESTDHRLQRDSSTTFLVEVHNRGTETDSYQVGTEFQFSEGGDTWAVDLIGVDQNDRVTVDGGDNALLRVKVTPPDGASLGDRARVLVTADSATSGGQENLTLEAQVTSQTVRDVGAFVLSDDRQEVRVNQKTQITAFAWNQGTATDGMSVSVVPNSTPEALDAKVAQNAVTGVSPGNVGSFPIQVTTGSDVQEGDEHSFQVEVQSRADPSVKKTLTVDTVVTAERSIKIVGLDHQNDQALDSLRYSRFNRSDEVNGEERPGSCEPAVRDEVERPSECKDFHNWTYHRAVVTNTGDQAEVVDLSLLPDGDIPGRTSRIPGPDDPGSCDPILADRIQKMRADRGIEPVQLVDGISHDDPGSETAVDKVQLDPGESRVVYLRVGYDGYTPYYENMGPDPDPCSQESHHATILASLDNGHTKTLSAETRFPFANTGDMSDEAKGRLALTDTYVREDGTQAELPARVGLELGEKTTINFTLSMQQAHEDQAHVELAGTEKIDRLEEKGWKIRLVSLDKTADREGPQSITVPASEVFEDNQTIGHASGVDYKLGLELTPPESGAQESQRFSFTVLASSDERPSETDSLGIDTQIGQTFDFGIDPGTQTIKAHPGDEVAFGLGISNEGATRDGYRIDTQADPSSVDVNAEPSNPRISSTSTQVSSIRAQVPAGASETQDVTIETSVTAERGTPSDKSDDLGPETASYTIDVRPPSTLTMESERSVTSVSPGGQTALNFSITNEKDTPQNLVISQVVGPPGWDTSLSEDNETRRIGAGETITQTVLVEAPTSIVEGSTFPFLIQAQNATDSSEFAVARAEAIAQGQTALSLEVEDNRTQVVDRGETKQFPLLIRNPGTSPTTYKLDASFQSDGWLAQFVEADSGNVLANETITVPENEFRRVLVEVQAPNDVDRGHVEDVAVEAFAQGQRSVNDDVTLHAEIHDFGVKIEVTGAKAKDAAPGDSVPFQVAITNTGNGRDEIQLGFAGPESDDPTYPVTSALTEDTTPTLAAGETLKNVTVEVQIPSPNPERAPVATEDGVTAVIQARSSGDLPGGNVPSATAEVTTRLVDYVIDDVDGDTAFEVAIDLNRDLSDGYEVFRDQDAQMIERGELNATQGVGSQGLYIVDGDEDDRAEHVIDTDADGVGNVYFDPDRSRTFEIPYAVDATGDAQVEHPIDADFDGVVDGVYDPADEELLHTAHLDLSGDGRPDLLVDTNGDTRFDKYVNPHEDPAVVTQVERDGDLYKVDTDGSGQVDTHYDVQTQSVQDAETANLQTFLGDYWYVVVVFLAVVVAFGVIFYRQL